MTRPDFLGRLRASKGAIVPRRSSEPTPESPGSGARSREATELGPVRRAATEGTMAPRRALRPTLTPQVAGIVGPALQQAYLASEVYNDYPKGAATCAVKGWVDASHDPVQLAKLGLTTDDLQPRNQSGFRARLYVPAPDSEAGGMPAQLVFRGTGATSVSDWRANVKQNLLGMDTEHYARAASLGRKLQSAPEGSVELVGHSLGGGMASAAALVSGKPATTFNAAGLNAKVRQKLAEDGVPLRAGTHINALYTPGEMLTSFQRSVASAPEALGTAISVGHGKGGPLAKPSAIERANRHRMASMISGLERHAAAGTEATLVPKERAGSVVPFGHFSMSRQEVARRLDRAGSEGVKQALRARLAQESDFVLRFAEQAGKGISPARMRFEGVDSATLMKDLATVLPPNMDPVKYRVILAGMKAKAQALQSDLARDTG
jgi:hypothetical protein